MPAWRTFGIILVLLLAPQTAHACRQWVPPPVPAGAYADIVRVAVTDSGFEGDQTRFYQWRATARVVEVISGRAEADSFSFGGAWESTGCPRMTPPPEAGTFWILYLENRDGRQQIAEARPLDTVMNAPTFWSIIDRTVALEVDPERQVAALRGELDRLSPDDVAAFANAFEQQLQNAYRWDVWAVAYIAHGGASDDGFEYFRRWLVSKGRDVFEQVLADPDSLAGLLAPDIEGVLEFEEIVYVAGEVWTAKTGLPLEQMPRAADVMTLGVEPDGEPFQEDPAALARAYPRTWARFGEAPLGY